MYRVLSVPKLIILSEQPHAASKLEFCVFKINARASVWPHQPVPIIKWPILVS